MQINIGMENMVKVNLPGKLMKINTLSKIMTCRTIRHSVGIYIIKRSIHISNQYYQSKEHLTK